MSPIASQKSPYDALLVVSFGGPESMDEVFPFLEKVLRGKNVPHERMIEVSHHYELFNGVSPINGQNRAMIAALEVELERAGMDLPIYWGNRNWHPLLEDTLKQMKADGIRNALAFFTSAYSSYSGCRQYREDIEGAQALVGADAPNVTVLRKFYNHPGFIEANVDHLRTALEAITESRRDKADVIFTAHSIPEGMARNSDYEIQIDETCRLVAEQVNLSHWQLAYQSRSGSPRQPWLGPDILDLLHELRTADASDVVIMPVGFISDHMEVLYDLDTEAHQLCAELGLNMVRAATAGVHPAFISMIRELVVERLSERPERRALGMRGPNHDLCPSDCCLPGAMRPMTAGPAAS